MIEKVVNTIEKFNLIQNGDKIVVAVSGGPDSISLLDILNKLRNSNIVEAENLNQKHNGKNKKIPKMNFEICVAHINHMIREEAEEDKKYVEQYCKKNGIDFYSKSIDVIEYANNKKIGTEEAGRIIRYNFFDEILEKTNSNKIAIAHNKNDRAETVMLNIIRGSGTAGLKGIEPKRGKYIRPLIECERYEIEQYCSQNNLNPRIDKTNLQNIYARNKIRNVVIPYIKKEFNPNIVETLNRLSQLVCEEEEYFDKTIENTYKKILVKEEKNKIILNLKKFNSQERVIKSKIILYTITRLFGTTKNVAKIHIEDIIKLCKKNIGNKYLMPNKNLKVLIKNKEIYFLANADFRNKQEKGQ